MHVERERVYADMARWLVRSANPVIVVDWCRLKGDGRWHLLRAAVPVGGRALTLLDMVFAQSEQGSAKAEKHFLERLKALIPADATPIIVADAGFRGPWCRTVEKLGWQWLVRLRHRTYVKPVDVADKPDQWLACQALHELVTAAPRDLGEFMIARSAPLRGRLVVYRKPPQGRHQVRRDGVPRRSNASTTSARREREPWLLACSPALAVTARQAVSLYTRRMQIELAFRDLKSHRYGQAFEDSLTRSARRIEVLLLLHTLAVFAAWLTGLMAEAEGCDQYILPHRAKRKLYSTQRVGWEALRRRWLGGATDRWLEQLRKPPDAVLMQMGLSS